MSLTLHDVALDEGCYSVRLLLGALGLPFASVPVITVPGAEGAKPPLPLTTLPGTPPILEHEREESRLVLHEAAAILVYLAMRFDPGRQWLPASPAESAMVMRWLVFSARELDAAVRARRLALWGDATGDGPADGPALEAASRRCLRAMDDHMTARGFERADWFVGGAPTIADLALFPAFALSRDAGIDHEAYPALRRWLRRVRSLPGFVTMPGIPDYA